MTARSFLAALLALVVLVACGTSPGSRQAEQRFEAAASALEAANARGADPEELQALMAALSDAARELARERRQELDDSLTALPASVEGGLVGIGAALLVHFRRSLTRRRAIEDVEAHVEEVERKVPSHA